MRVDVHRLARHVPRASASVIEQNYVIFQTEDANLVRRTVEMARVRIG